MNGTKKISKGQIEPYTTIDVTDSVNKRYQTDNQRTFNDATSSIQTQLNSKISNPVSITVTTTTSVLTPITTIAIPLNTSKSIKYHLKGRDTLGNTFGAECFYVAKNIAGVVTLVSTVSIDRKSNFATSVQTGVSIVGTNTVINITAQNGVTTTWDLFITQIL